MKREQLHKSLEKLESLSRWLFPWAAGTLEIKERYTVFHWWVKQMSRFSKFFCCIWWIQEGWCLKRSSIQCEAFNFLRQDHVVSSAHLNAKSILASRATKSNSSSVAMDLPQLGSQAKDELFLSSMKGNHQFAAAMTVFLRLRSGSRRTTRVWGCLVWSGWSMIDVIFRGAYTILQEMIQWFRLCVPFLQRQFVFDPSEDSATVGSPSALATVWGSMTSIFSTWNIARSHESWQVQIIYISCCLWGSFKDWILFLEVILFLQASPTSWTYYFKALPCLFGFDNSEIPGQKIWRKVCMRCLMYLFFVGEGSRGRSRLWWGGTVFFPDLCLLGQTVTRGRLHKMFP